MANLFDELAAQEIPPLPENFHVTVHRRVNRTLIVLHFLDLFGRGIPWAMAMFAKGVVGFFAYTLTGKYIVERKRSPESDLGATPP